MYLKSMILFFVLSFCACAGAISQDSSKEESEPNTPRPTTAVVEEVQPPARPEPSPAPKEDLAEALPTTSEDTSSKPEPTAPAGKTARWSALIGPSDTHEQRVDTAKDLTLLLCEILMKGDRDGFERLLHSDTTRDSMRYWWNASSKGRYFRKLFAKCTFNNLDVRNSNTDHLKIFIKRWVRRLDRYTMPAPVRFRRDPRARGAWRLISYSL